MSFQLQRFHSAFLLGLLDIVEKISWKVYGEFYWNWTIIKITKATFITLESRKSSVVGTNKFLDKPLSDCCQDLIV